jgi:hypothetical protein
VPRQTELADLPPEAIQVLEGYAGSQYSVAGKNLIVGPIVSYRCSLGGVMSDELNAAESAQLMLPLHRLCSQCQQSASSISLVRTREGKSFRLYKCTSCGGLAWLLKEQQPNSQVIGRIVVFHRRRRIARSPSLEVIRL